MERKEEKKRFENERTFTLLNTLHKCSLTTQHCSVYVKVDIWQMNVRKNNSGKRKFNSYVCSRSELHGLFYRVPIRL